MIIPDANLLLYCYDSSSRFHQPASRWWLSCLGGVEPVGLCAVVLFAFLCVSTNRKAFENPLTMDEAGRIIRSWLDHPMTEYVAAEEADIVQAVQWLESAGVGGNLTTDAQIAAIAFRCRGTVHTADTDFGRFAGVRWLNPLMKP